MKNLDFECLKALNEVFKRLNILRRWTSFVTEDKYNELAKQALNCIIAYILAAYCEKDGETICWERFPKIALYRAFQKAYVYFDTPENIIDEICQIGNIKKSLFDGATKEIIVENTSEQFGDFICEGVGTYEMQIYKAATKIATLVELIENQQTRGFDEYQTKLIEIQKALMKYKNIRCVSELSEVDGEIFKLFLKISKLRNQNRWSVMPYAIECSVLGHLFDTGCLSYIIGLEENSGNETIATKMFFMGIFHDLAEVWTTDIPSPIKDRIPGFRNATEKYELEVIEKQLYRKVPDYIASKLKEVMFEEDENAGLKKLIKAADYLSADLECWRQYNAGVRDSYFFGAMSRYNEKLISGKLRLTPICKELHDYTMEYARRCVEQLKF